MSELLEACTPARKTELGGLLRSLTDQIRRRGLLVIVSDLFTDLDAVYDGLNRLRFLGHEVLVLQVLDRDELELPFDGPTIFQDIEGDEELFAEPGPSAGRTRGRCTSSSTASAASAAAGATITSGSSPTSRWARRSLASSAPARSRPDHSGGRS